MEHRKWVVRLTLLAVAALFCISNVGGPTATLVAQGPRTEPNATFLTASEKAALQDILPVSAANDEVASINCANSGLPFVINLVTTNGVATSIKVPANLGNSPCSVILSCVGVPGTISQVFFPHDIAPAYVCPPGTAFIEATGGPGVGHANFFFAVVQ
jgi:hypothetical protein